MILHYNIVHVDHGIIGEIMVSGYQSFFSSSKLPTDVYNAEDRELEITRFLILKT